MITTVSMDIASENPHRNKIFSYFSLYDIIAQWDASKYVIML